MNEENNVRYILIMTNILRIFEKMISFCLGNAHFPSYYHQFMRGKGRDSEKDGK